MNPMKNPIFWLVNCLNQSSACDSVSERPPELLLSRRGRCNRKSRVSTESLLCASVMLVHCEASWNDGGKWERLGKWSMNSLISQ